MDMAILRLAGIHLGKTRTSRQLFEVIKKKFLIVFGLNSRNKNEILICKEKPNAIISSKVYCNKN